MFSFYNIKIWYLNKDCNLRSSTNAFISNLGGFISLWICYLTKKRKTNCLELNIQNVFLSMNLNYPLMDYD